MVIVAQKNSPLLVNCSDPSLSWINESEVKFKWFKDGRVMTPDSKRISVSQNGSLYFQSIKRKKRRGMNDEGFYECHKTFTSGTVIAKRVEIQIASKYSFSFIFQFYQSNFFSFDSQLEFRLSPIFSPLL